jgi:hypothetical protein
MYVCMYVCMYLFMYVLHTCLLMHILMHYVCTYFFNMIYEACSTALSSTTCRTDFLLHRFYILGFVYIVQCSFKIKSVSQFVVWHQSLLR